MPDFKLFELNLREIKPKRLFFVRIFRPVLFTAKAVAYQGSASYGSPVYV
jgi:hypothetical protein